MTFLTKRPPGKFIPHPATDGPVRGVIVDITPPERKQTPYGEKEVFRVVIESELEKEDGSGERFCVWSKNFTPSLHPKAAFRAFLKKAFGRDVAETDVDAEGRLNIDRLCLGHPVQMSVVHEHSGSETYANISHLAPDRGGDPLQPCGAYVRKANRTARAARGEPAA